MAEDLDDLNSHKRAARILSTPLLRHSNTPLAGIEDDDEDDYEAHFGTKLVNACN
jgi:hypothetical protein